MPLSFATATDRPVASHPLRWHIWMAALAVVFVLILPTRADPDLWGHVRFGLDWLQSHHVPSIDPYSFTHDRPYVDHEWLGEVLMGAAFSIARAQGLIGLKAVTVLAALAVVAWRVRRAAPMVSAALVLLSAASALPIIGTSRPQTTSLVGLALVIAIADSTVSYTRRVVMLACVFAAWANLHGGWITGLGALGAYAAVQWYCSRTTLPRAIGIVGIPFAATLVNAYGPGLWRFLALTVRTSRPDITEWQPIGLHEPVSVWFSVLFPVALLAIASLRRGARPRPEIVAAIAVLFLAGLRVSRVAPLIGPAVAAALGPCLAEGYRRGTAARAISRGEAWVLAIPVAVLWIGALPYIARDFDCIPIRDAWAPDTAAARHLAGATGRLWVAFDWGEYAFWHFGPALRVSIDGRREAVYSDAVIQMHRGFDEGLPQARDAFLRLSPDYVWLRRSAGTEHWLLAHGYRMLAQTDASFVAARADVTPPDVPSTRDADMCFP